MSPPARPPRRQGPGPKRGEAANTRAPGCEEKRDPQTGFDPQRSREAGRPKEAAGSPGGGSARSPEARPAPRLGQLVPARRPVAAPARAEGEAGPRARQQHEQQQQRPRRPRRRHGSAPVPRRCQFEPRTGSRAGTPRPAPPGPRAPARPRPALKVAARVPGHTPGAGQPLLPPVTPAPPRPAAGRAAQPQPVREGLRWGHVLGVEPDPRPDPATGHQPRGWGA